MLVPSISPHLTPFHHHYTPNVLFPFFFFSFFFKFAECTHRYFKSCVARESLYVSHWRHLVREDGTKTRSNVPKTWQHFPPSVFDVHLTVALMFLCRWVCVNDPRGWASVFFLFHTFTSCFSINRYPFVVEMFVCFSGSRSYFIKGKIMQCKIILVEKNRQSAIKTLLWRQHPGTQQPHLHNTWSPP